MATKKRSKGGRAAASRAKTSAGARAASRKAKPKKAATKPKSAVKAKSIVKAKSATPPKNAMPAKSVKPTQPTAAKPGRIAAADNKELVALKNRFQRERSGLEKNLTEAVREIGILRHHEMRVTQLERQLKERDDLIGRLQQQLEELQRRPVEPIYEREVQQSFALVVPAPDEVDEFEDAAQLADETELEDEEV